MLNAEVAWSQIVGKRKSQQDHAAILSWPNGFKLMLLADGMGGHAHGEIASQLVIDTFKQSFIASDETDMRRRLILALDAANKSVFEAIKADPDKKGMGTTLIAVIYDGQSVQWLSVGDSPMWLIRKGEIKRINKNHSMRVILASQVAAGEITAEEAARAPNRSQLLEAVMGEDIHMVDAPETILPLEKNDWLIMASDGVESCPQKTLCEIFSNPELVAEHAPAKVLTAVDSENRPGQDNATIVVLNITAEAVEEPITVDATIREESVEEPKTRHQ